MVITEDGLAGDNRFGSSEWAMEAYEDFLNGSIKEKLFGYGKDLRVIPGTKINIWQTVCSYKEYVFGFGFLGLGIMIFGFIATVIMKYRKIPRPQTWSIFVLLFVFLISIYQRYSVTSFRYYCVLFGGASNLALMNVKEIPEPKKKIIFRW